MTKYYYRDASGQQQGPLSIEDLKGLNLTTDTPVWYDPLPQWTTAGQVDELKNIIAIAPTSETITTAAEIKPAEPIMAEAAVQETVITAPVTATTAAATALATAATKTAGNKSTAWLSWVLSLLVLCGAGYFIYQDIEKNKDNTNAADTLTVTTTSTDTATTEQVVAQDTNATDTTVADTNMADTTTTTVTTTSTEPPTATTTTTANTKDKQLLAKQKADAEKKKQQLLAKQKADEEKKQQLAAQALAAKQLQIRNNWSKHITLGSLNYQPKGDDGMTAFDVPVYNGTDVPLNKVTVRIDYYKKEKKDKIVSSETVTLYNIPPKSGLNGKAPENKKSRKAVATITSITSRQLHFCYPQGNGNSSDPYFCN